MRLLLIVLLLSGATLKAQQLLPQPQQVNLTNGIFKINPQTKFRLKNNAPKLKAYTERFIQRLQFKSETFFTTSTLQDTANQHEILITAETIVDTLNINTNESYELVITENQIQLKAQTNIGAYRGLETLLQMVSFTTKNGAYFKTGTIKDEPRFKWRGLLIDVCRHWIPASVIKRNIDAMAAVKLNVLHLHLTEDQGFRIESKKFPKLHQQGSNGKYFTQHEIKNIVEYANARGIRVVPELDIPGHVTSWLVGHPELAAVNKNYKTETGFGVFNPSLNPAEESTYNFLDTLLTEISNLFPDEYFHIGGDENNGKHWDTNKKIQRFKLKNELNSNEELQAYFNGRVLNILQRNQKKMIGWDEILTPQLPKSIAIQSWRGKQSMITAAQQGYPSILSNGFYLDKVYPLEQYYANNPLPDNIPLSEKEKTLILGGEATMWSELVDESNIESRIWPSCLAIAERLWSSEEDCNVKELYKKVPKISAGLQEFGLQHLNFQKAKLALISKNTNINPALPFIQALEPVKGYKRHQLLKGTPKYNTQAPFNRLADALYTESFTARSFNQLMLKNCSAEGLCKKQKEIKQHLASWLKASENFQKITATSKTLQEVQQLAYKVQELCELSWRKVNSPSELSETENDRAIQLIKEIEALKITVQFAPIQGIKVIFPKD